jgi:hypothetical protein
MLAIAWVISVALALFLGYHYGKLVKYVHNIKQLVTPEKKEVEEKSTFFDPDDPATQVKLARMEADERIARLNPDE